MHSRNCIIYQLNNLREKLNIKKYYKNYELLIIISVHDQPLGIT